MSYKNQKSEMLEVTPDPSLFGKLGARSKALPNVVTELIDNSLDSWTLMPASYKKGKTLEVRVVAGSVEGSSFTVTDNAGGMTLAELQNAMTIAKSDKEEVAKKTDKGLLGFYGFGLKSAAMFIGDEFRIYTQSYKDPKVVHYVDFNRDKFESSNPNTRWKLEFHSISLDQAAKLEAHFPNGHGTIIRIKNKRYRAASQYGIVERLRRTFAPRLPCDKRLQAQNKEYSDDPMHIYFITKETKASTAKPLTALGPFYTFWDGDKREIEKYYSERLKELKNTRDQIRRGELLDELATSDPVKGVQKDERGSPTEAILPSLDWLESIPGIKRIKEFTVAGKKVHGRVAILDRGLAHTSEYGFDLIKNGRIIETFAKDAEKKKEQFIGLVANNHNARIVGQLFLDDWETDHQKTEFIKEQDGWSKNESKKGKDLCISDVIHKFIKDEGFISASYSLQSPRSAIPGVKDSTTSEERVTSEKVSEASPAIANKLSKSVRSSNFSAQLKKIDKEAGASFKKDLKKHEESKPTASSKLQLTKPEIIWEKKGASNTLYLVRAVDDRKNKRLLVTLNLDHPFLKKKESGQIKVIGELIAAEAFAAYMAKEKLILGSGFDHYVALRDNLLRESS